MHARVRASSRDLRPRMQQDVSVLPALFFSSFCIRFHSDYVLSYGERFLARLVIHLVSQCVGVWSYTRLL